MQTLLHQLTEDEQRMKEATPIILSIPQRIIITNGLYWVVGHECHLSEDGTSICDARGILSDQQACDMLMDGIKVALSAQMSLRRVLDAL